MKRKIGKRVSKEILRLYKSISNNLINFQQNSNWQSIDFWQIAQVIPELRFVYAQHLLENKVESEYPKIKTEIDLIIFFTFHEKVSKYDGKNNSSSQNVI